MSYTGSFFLRGQECKNFWPIPQKLLLLLELLCTLPLQEKRKLHRRPVLCRNSPVENGHELKVEREREIAERGGGVAPILPLFPSLATSPSTFSLVQKNCQQLGCCQSALYLKPFDIKHMT